MKQVWHECMPPWRCWPGGPSTGSTACSPSHTFTFEMTGAAREISIRLMRQSRVSVQTRPRFIHLPIPLFGWLLQLRALISHQPAFTKDQLKAFTAGENFKVINWLSIISVLPPTLGDALRNTHQDPRFLDLVISF